MTHGPAATAFNPSYLSLSLSLSLYLSIYLYLSISISLSSQLVNVRGDPAAVEALALAINAMDAALARFKGRQGDAMAKLQEEEATLEQEIDAIASRIEAEMAAGPATAAPAERTPSAARPSSASG